MKRNRNDEIEPDENIGFDMKSWEADQMAQPAEDWENPYDDYDTFEIEIAETVKKTVSVMAKDAKSAREYVESLDIDMEKGVDSYEKTVTVLDYDGKTDIDYTVPVEWYDGRE